MKFYITFFALMGLMYASGADAQVLYLQSGKSTYHVGDSFSVSLLLDTKGKAINTVGAMVDIPINAFQVIDVRYGNSIIPLWVEQPKVDYANGYITFTGGIPGGFSGSSGPILTFGLKAKKVTDASVRVQNIKMLLNDGLGTEVGNVSASPLSISIEKAIEKPQVSPKTKTQEKPVVAPEVYTPIPDTTPPEEFTPFVSRNPNVEGDKYFLSFFAVDKDTGIAHYEIVESPFLLNWFTTKLDIAPVEKDNGPYVLQGQWWSYRVIVRAYDQAGNVKEESVTKPFHPMIVGILILLLMILTSYITRAWVMKKYGYKPMPIRRTQRRIKSNEE